MPTPAPDPTAPDPNAPDPNAPDPNAIPVPVPEPGSEDLTPGLPGLDPELLRLLTATPPTGIPATNPVTSPAAGSDGQPGPGAGQQVIFHVAPPRYWIEAGTLFLARTYHVARFWHPPYNEGQVRAQISEEIDRLQWTAPRWPQPFDPAGVVTELLRKLPLDQITAAADNGRLELPEGPETTVYGLYGLEGMVRGVRVRFYILDGAYAAFLLAVDAHVAASTVAATPDPAGTASPVSPQGTPTEAAEAGTGTGAGAVICSGYVELDTTAWLAARTRGTIPALTDLLLDFEETLSGQTSLHLDVAPLFITARVGHDWAEAEHAVIATGFNGGGPVSLSEDLIIHRYTDPTHGPVAVVAATNGFRTGPHTAYVDAALEGSDWCEEDRVEIFCPAGHAWTYSHGELIDTDGRGHRVEDVFPDGELVTDAEPPEEQDQAAGLDEAAHHQDSADAEVGAGGRIICPVCGQDCDVALPGH